MSEVMQILKHRRSIRKYTGERIPGEDLRNILEAGLIAPTGHNKKTVEFAVVESREKLLAMRGCRTGSANMLEHAGAAVVVMVHGGVTDTFTEDMSCAMMSMHIAADALGYGSCWIQVAKRPAADDRPSEEFLKELLGLPADVTVGAVLSVGVPAETKPARTADDADFSKVRFL